MPTLTDPMSQIERGKLYNAFGVAMNGMDNERLICSGIMLLMMIAEHFADDVTVVDMMARLAKDHIGSRGKKVN